ncbi:MAG: hypothetical protein MUE40_19945 [Anaerolineae bacterium]|jgi:hypothetical protein|nr:hypothetical protein [Anaerolineae bacterium]
MIRLRRKNTVWLTVLGLVIAFALLAGNITLPVQLALLGVFGVAVLASMVQLGRERESLIQALRRAPVRQRVSAQAREATERAKGHNGYLVSGLTMLDVGLIALQSSSEGMAMRRARTVSKDDDGARPFITLNVEPEEADRNALVRFEILNHYGEQVYVHEMKAYLRDGEMSLMADHHLPLAGNRGIGGTGDWDLRVFIDGNLAAIHNFTLAPGLSDRTRRLSSQYEDSEPETVFDIIDEVQQDVSPSLQDLLQQQSRPPARNPAADSSSDGASRRIGTSTRRRR